MRLSHILSIGSIAVSCLVIGSCAKEVDSIRPRGAIAQDQLSESDLEKVVNGIYAAMEEFVFDYYFDGDIKGENFIGGPGFALNDPMLMTAGSSGVLSLWRKSFSTLKQVNFLVETYESSKNQASNAVKIGGGAAYYFRALIYYNMAIRWGGVPILRKRTDELVPISPEADVWNFILEDLGKAEQLLPDFSSKYYLSQSANDALFAKTYFSCGNNAKAVEYANKVIAQTSNFALAGNANEYAATFVHNTQSKEIVFALVNARSTGALLFYQRVNDVDPTWNYAPAADCYANLYADQAEKSGDIRAQAVFGADPQRTLKFANGQSGQFIANGNPAQSPIVVTRIAEMYLIKAEAQGNTVDGKQTLQTFLDKRYTTLALGATTDIEYQNQILDERHREFFGEGFRWYDLKRANRLDLFQSLNGRNYLMYFPVPQNEIDLAGKNNYPQNQGYE